jgi:hypothetical protein
VRKSRDLSMTYHIVAYRRGDVQRWDKIFDTTLDIADQEYPYGWLQNGELTNHHAYDVARILKLGWNRVSERHRERARSALARLPCGSKGVQPVRMGDAASQAQRCCLHRTERSSLFGKSR